MSYVSIAVGNVFLGLATVVFLAYVLRRRDVFGNLRSFKGYFVVIGIFLATMLLSALGSGHLAKGMKTFAEVMLWRMMPFVLILTALSDEERATKRILCCSLLGIFIGSVCVIYQGLSGDLRASAFFGHPMTFAGWMCVYLPVLAIMFFDVKVVGKWRWLAGVLFLVVTAALLFNATRGAWLAMIVVLSLLMLIYSLRDKRIAAFYLLFVFALGTCLHTSAYLAERLNSSTNLQANRQRVLIWTGALNMFKDHKLLGVGLGQYKDNYQKKYILPQATEPKLEHAHSNLLQMLAENGLIGFLGFILLAGYIVCRNFLDWWRTRSPYALMAVSATVGLFLQGLTEYNFGNSAVMKAYWLVLACVLVLRAHEDDAK
jgi:O-antigen ligase